MSLQAIGIDLGSSNSCVAVFRNEKAEVISNFTGNTVTASYVAFGKTGRLVGDEAKVQQEYNPANTLHDPMSLLGSNPNLHDELKYRAYKIGLLDDKPRIQVTHQRDRHFTVTPEEVSAIILEHMKKMAEDFLKAKIQDAVISVPASYNDLQRQAVKSAAKIAGLNVLRIINSPTAAAISQCHKNKNFTDRKVLVIDIGGGSTELSVINSCHGTFKVLATSTSSKLCGEAFDNRLLEHLKKEISKNHNVDFNDTVIFQLLKICEKAKRVLTAWNLTEIKEQIAGVKLQTTVKREKFESLNKDLFASIINLITPILNDAHLKKGDIDEVILSGGSSQIPKLKRMIERFFGSKKVHCVDVKEQVACGAAIQAANQLNQLKSNLLLVWDAIPLDLSVNLNGQNLKVMSRNTTYPTKTTKCYWTFKDFSDGMDFQLYQGNILLGDFRLDKISEISDEETIADLTFAIDADGILEVNATMRSPNMVKNIKINTKRTLNQSVMERVNILKNDKMVGRITPIQRQINLSELEGTLMKHAEKEFDATVDITNLESTIAQVLPQPRLTLGYETSFKNGQNAILASTFTKRNSIQLKSRLPTFEEVSEESEQSFSITEIANNSVIPPSKFSLFSSDSKIELGNDSTLKPQINETFEFTIPSMTTMRRDLNSDLNSSSFAIIENKVNKAKLSTQKPIRESIFNDKISESSLDLERTEQSIDSFAFSLTNNMQSTIENIGVDSFDFTMPAPASSQRTSKSISSTKRKPLKENRYEDISSLLYMTAESNCEISKVNREHQVNLGKKQAISDITSSSSSSSATSLINMTNSERELKVFIKNARSEGTLSNEEFKLVIRLLMKQYESAEEGVSFQGNGFENGVGWIKCSNEISSKWLIKTIPVIQKDLPNIKLKVSNRMNELTKAVVVIPCEEDDKLTPESVFKILAKSNPGLSTEEWEVSTMDKGFTSVAFNLLIDKKSVLFLRKVSYRPIYIFDRVFFNVNEFL